MSDLTISAVFTKNSGQPATGLALADIDLYLTRQHRSTGAADVVWDGSQNPTGEIDNVGGYIRIYAAADLDTYNYHGAANYTGGTALDVDWVIGSVGRPDIPAGTAIEFTYTITNSSNGLPIEGVEVWFSTNAIGSNVVWYGTTDAFGVVRDASGNLPRLDAGTYYVFRQRAGFTFADPDTEVVG